MTNLKAVKLQVQYVRTPDYYIMRIVKELNYSLFNTRTAVKYAGKNNFRKMIAIYIRPNFRVGITNLANPIDMTLICCNSSIRR